MNKKIGIVITLWLAISCQTSVQTPQSNLGLDTQKTGDPSNSQEPKKNVNSFQQFSHIRQLTTVGTNNQPAFSKMAHRILFVSRDRPSHSHAQIYELDLATTLERRITHHSGDDFSPRYLRNDTKLLYSSSTDERKANRQLIRAVLNRFAKKSESESKKEISHSVTPSLLPSELYLSDLRGNNIQRLTYQEGFDGLPSIHPSSSHIAFSSEGARGVELLLLDLKSHKIKSLVHVEPWSLQPAFSPDGTQLVWVQSDPAQSVSQLYLAPLTKNPAHSLKKGKWEQITWALRRHESPSWHPNGHEILFSANLAHRDFMNLYVLDLTKRCLKEILISNSNEADASFSSDGKKILFSSDQSGTPQIYVMEYTPPLQCLPEVL